MNKQITVTLEELEKHGEVIKAYLADKPVQFQLSDGAWVDTDTPSFSLCNKYRIKPEQQYRPWKMTEVPLGLWVRHKKIGYVYTVTDILADGVRLGQSFFRYNELLMAYEYTLHAEGLSINEATWRPCGVKEDVT